MPAHPSPLLRRLIATLGGSIAAVFSIRRSRRNYYFATHRILKGDKAGDVPVQVLGRYQLTINLKTARELGVTIPAEMLQRADRVIQ